MLPNKDLNYKLFNQLDDKNLVSVCSINKESRKIYTDQNFWLQRILSKFNYIPLEVLRKNKGDRKWSEYYINDLREVDDKNKAYYLIEESKNGRLDLVMISMFLGANIHDYALMWASQYGHLEIVKFLINKGANIHANDDEALRLASANIHANDDETLRLASDNGRLDVVKFLVDKGANIHARDDTALRWSSEYGHLDVVKYLVEKGANIHAGNDYALKYANRNGYSDVVNYLKSLP